MYFYIMDGKYLSRAPAKFNLQSSPIEHRSIHILTPHIFQCSQNEAAGAVFAVLFLLFFFEDAEGFAAGNKML